MTWAGTGRHACPRRVVAAFVALLLALVLTASARAATVQTFPVQPGNAGLQRIVAGPDGNLWFTAQNAYDVDRITTQGQITAFASPQQSFDSGGENGPFQITSSGGGLWYLSTSGADLFRLSPDGTLAQFGNGATEDSPGDPNSLKEPSTNLIPSGTGGVWMTSLIGYDDIDDGGLRRVAADGQSFQDFPASYGGIIEPVPLIPGPGGSAWIGDSDGNVQEVTAAGQALTFPVTGVAPDEYISSMAFDRSGNLWFTMFVPGSAFFPDTQGAIGELKAGAPTATAVEMTTPNTIPKALVLGPDGNMYFGWKSGIGQINPATGTAQLASLNGLTITDMTVGSDGALWFVDNNANQVGRIALGTKKKLPLAPRLALRIPHTTLKQIGGRHRMTVRCTMRGPGTCAATAQVTTKVGRGLGLKVRKHASSVTLARASKHLKHKGHTTLTLRFSRKLSHRLASRHKVSLRLIVRSSAPKHRARTLHRSVTIH